MQAGFLQVPDWFSTDNQGCGIAVADLAGDGTQDLVVFMIDNPPGQNRGLYRVGRSLDANGNVTGGWTGWADVPDWFSCENQGGGIAVADLNGDGTQDLVVFMIDNPPGQNRGLYRVGRSLDANGNVTGGWTGWADVPNWFSWENQGGGDRRRRPQRGRHPGPGRVHDRQSAGGEPRASTRSAGHWTPTAMSPAAGPAGSTCPTGSPGRTRALASRWSNRGAENDLVVFAIDNPPGQNQAFYRILPGVTADGTSSHEWSSWLGVPNWFSWENQGGSIAPRVTGGTHELAVLMVDHPAGQNAGLYRFLPLDTDPRTQGSWELLPYHSGVLAIHAAVLRSGKVMFFAGSGNNQVRVASPDYGNVAKGIYTSVTWDPTAPAAGGANFFHPDTITGPDHKPFDFFCGGDTFLPDGTLLSAGGNLAYPGKGRHRRRRLRPGNPAVASPGSHAAGTLVPHPAAAGRRARAGGQRAERERHAEHHVRDLHPGHRLLAQPAGPAAAACSSACPCTRTCSCSATAGCSSPAAGWTTPTRRAPC